MGLIFFILVISFFTFINLSSLFMFIAYQLFENGHNTLSFWVALFAILCAVVALIAGWCAWILTKVRLG